MSPVRDALLVVYLSVGFVLGRRTAVTYAMQTAYPEDRRRDRAVLLLLFLAIVCPGIYILEVVLFIGTHSYQCYRYGRWWLIDQEIERRRRVALATAKILQGEGRDGGL